MTMGKNKVLETTRSLIENPKYVRINKKALDDLAKKFAKEDLKIPS